MRKPRLKLSGEVEHRMIIEATTLRDVMSWPQLCRHFNVGEDWLKRRLVEGYVSRANQRYRAQMGYAKPVKNPPPPDTRDFTARFCGDPLPGRSALDQRGDA